MTAILTAITPATAGAPAVRARFLLARRDEIIVNGTVVRVTGVTTSQVHIPGQTVIDGRDAEDRDVTIVVPSTQMVELYDRAAADEALRGTLNSMVAA